MCICIADSLCYKAEANTPLQINYTPIKVLKKICPPEQHFMSPFHFPDTCHIHIPYVLLISVVSFLIPLLEGRLG